MFVDSTYSIIFQVGIGLGCLIAAHPIDWVGPILSFVYFGVTYHVGNEIEANYINSNQRGLGIYG